MFKLREDGLNHELSSFFYKKARYSVGSVVFFLLNAVVLLSHIVQELCCAFAFDSSELDYNFVHADLLFAV